MNVYQKFIALLNYFLNLIWVHLVRFHVSFALIFKYIHETVEIDKNKAQVLQPKEKDRSKTWC